MKREKSFDSTPRIHDLRLARRATAVGLRIGGTAALVLGIAFEYLGFFIVPLSIAKKRAVLGIPASIVLSFVGIGVFRLGRRLNVRSRRHLNLVLPSDWTPESGSFTLYLRSFSDDVLRQSTDEIHLGATSVSYTLANIPISGLAQEEQLVGALTPIGPVVAVGRPGETLPLAGAHRMYPPDGAWQETVLGLMRESGLVIIAAGLGDGLMWEYLQAVQTVSPDRLVLVVFMDAESYERFRETSTSEFATLARKPRTAEGKAWSPPVLPEYPSAAELGDATAWIIRFEADWTPVSVTLKKTNRTSPRHRKGLWLAFSEALLPTFEKLKVEAAVIDEITNTLARTKRIELLSIYLIITFLGAAFGFLAGLIIGALADLAQGQHGGANSAVNIAMDIAGAVVGAAIVALSKAGRDLMRDLRDVRSSHG